MPGRGCSREALAAVAVIMPRFSGPVCANAWQHVGRVDCRAFSAWQRAAGDDMAADEMPGVVSCRVSRPGAADAVQLSPG